MGKGVVILLVVSATAVSVAGYGMRECPPWFEWVNTSDSSGYCACATNEYKGTLQCDQKRQVSFVYQGSCALYDFKNNASIAVWCPYLFPDDVLQDGMFPLPANFSELNTVVCGNLTREVKGPLCGRCTGNTGPSIYSVGIRCVHCSPVNILYYLLLQYGPSTLIFLLVIIFRPNITSAPMLHYVFFCNTAVLYVRSALSLYEQLNQGIAATALTFSALWSFDALLFISPSLCISPHIEEIYIPCFEFLATLYPFVLLLLTYAMIKLQSKGFKPLVIIWGLCSRGYVKFYRAWDPRSSMIQAFASLFFLSYAKLAYVFWKPLFWIKISEAEFITYTDPNIPYSSFKHYTLIILSVIVAVVGFGPPLLILIVYPTSLYRKISDRISPVWRIRIQVYVECFNKSVKDGTNGTRDYRSFSGWLLVLFGFFPQVLLALAIATLPTNNITNGYYIIALYFSILAFLCALFQPYKENVSNALTIGILLIASMLLAVAVGMFDNQQREAVKVIMTVLLLIPHCVFWGYIAYRLANAVVKRCCSCSSATKYGESKRLLSISTDNSS